MILVDTSVWIDHLRVPDPLLAGLLNQDRVLAHPFVIGEIALGNLRDRGILSLLSALPQTTIATDHETMRFIERYAVYGQGIGFVDVHLLASTLLTQGAALLTRDKRLREVAFELGLAAQF